MNTNQSRHTDVTLKGTISRLERELQNCVEDLQSRAGGFWSKDRESLLEARAAELHTELQRLQGLSNEGAK